MNISAANQKNYDNRRSTTASCCLAQTRGNSEKITTMQFACA